MSRWPVMANCCKRTKLFWPFAVRTSKRYLLPIPANIQSVSIPPLPRSSTDIHAATIVTFPSYVFVIKSLRQVYLPKMFTRRRQRRRFP